MSVISCPSSLKFFHSKKKSKLTNEPYSFNFLGIFQRILTKFALGNANWICHLIFLTSFLISFYTARRCPTGGILAGYSGVLSSPHFPEDYPHRVNCEWIIRVPKGYHIQLVFTTFDIEYCVFCKCDYVEIRDGRNSSSPLLGKYCENGKLSPIFSTGRHLWIKFYSDVGARFQGFRAVYKAKKTGQSKLYSFKNHTWKLCVHYMHLDKHFLGGSREGLVK